MTTIALIAASLALGAGQPQGPAVPNGGLEELDAASGFATNWIRGFGTGTRATAEIDETVARSGKRSLRMTDATPTEAYKYAIANTHWIDVRPATTYVAAMWVRGHGVGKAFIGAAMEGAGEHRRPLPVGDYDWREATIRFTTPETCRRINVQIVLDGVTDALWADDVRIDVSPVQLANLAEVREPRPYAEWYPRTPGAMPRKLVVADITAEPADTQALLVALQGLVNRKAPGLYLINQTNPQRYDEMWFDYLKAKGYTGEPVRLAKPMDALTRFRSAFRGLVVWDPELPGSVNAAWMLAGVLDALPASPEMAARTKLPIVEDLRGRWKRNVDAYRYVFDKHWPSMSHHLLAWEYPLTNALSSRDVMVQRKVFLFWASAYTDQEKGADPQAEMEFIEEILGKTPGNVPVMGWPMYGTRGVEEYTAVRTLSEYGKWVPGTGYNSNGTVLSAVRPAAAVFRQKFRTSPPPAPKLDPAKAYISVSIMDSGDAHWYWQFHQRKIWADPARGSVPIGYAMNPTVLDALPLVAQWYYENMTPNDSFFGLIYMNAPVYGSRFRAADRERIWGEFVSLMDRYRRRLDMDGIELYNGGSSAATAPPEMIRRFTKGMPGLKYVLADLGRHTDIHADNATRTYDGVTVFHTLTNFRVWTTSEEVANKKMADENPWLVGEIRANTPKSRPAFMSALAISWCYYPAWLKDLRERLAPDHIVVSPGDLARLATGAARR